MEEKGKNTGNNKVIKGDFHSEPQVQDKKLANISSNQSNPILNKLFKLTHTALSKTNENYKSFAKFKPEDLR